MEYLTVREAAVALGLSVLTVNARIERGEMKAERLGARIWAIPRTEVDRWKTIGRQKPGRKPRAESQGGMQ